MKKSICLVLMVVLMFVAFPQTVEAACVHQYGRTRVLGTYRVQTGTHSHIDGYDFNGNPIYRPCVLMDEYEKRQTYCSYCGAVGTTYSVKVASYHHRVY